MINKEVKELVSLRGETAFTTSMIIAEKFEKEHFNVLRDIDKYIKDLSLQNLMVNSYFREISFINPRGREYRGFEVTEMGFALVALSFRGSKAFEFKLDFIRAFKAMQDLLLERAAADWQRARLQIKGARRHLTDVIQDLVEYATNQGSTNAKHYYTLITRETYKALKFIEKNEKVGTGFRDTLNRMDLAYLIAAETICEQWIIVGMQEGYHYKDIYRLAMDKVIEYGEHVIIPAKEARRLTQGKSETKKKGITEGGKA